MSAELDEARVHLHFWRAMVERVDLTPENRIDARTRESFWFDRVSELMPSKEGWYWLSFADAERPKGQQFLGVAIVWGRHMMLACQEARRLSINPGGEVLCHLLEHAPPEHLRNRLLDRATLEASELGESVFVQRGDVP